MIHWTHCSEPPTERGVTAILARRDIDTSGEYTLMPGVFQWHPADGWTRKHNRTSPVTSDVWYCLERDLIAHLGVFVARTINGHG